MIRYETKENTHKKQFEVVRWVKTSETSEQGKIMGLFPYGELPPYGEGLESLNDKQTAEVLANSFKDILVSFER